MTGRFVVVRQWVSQSAYKVVHGSLSLSFSLQNSEIKTRISFNKMYVSQLHVSLVDVGLRVRQRQKNDVHRIAHSLRTKTRTYPKRISSDLKKWTKRPDVEESLEGSST